VLAAAIAIGLGLNFVGIDPIRALYVSAILNGLAAPPLILLMLILSRSRRAELRTGRLSDALMVIALLVLSASAAVYLIGSLVG
jgi:Mn2+/Fe2+ NRAMP family transporter